MPLNTDVHTEENRELARPDTETAKDREAAIRAACLFHGFSDISRMRIVQHLFTGEHNVKELTDHLGLAQTTVSGHLACLLDCGIVRRRAVGRSSMYSLTQPEETMALLAAAQALLSATGEAVALCPRHGIDVLQHTGKEER